jgi:hypothetical protein
MAAKENLRMKMFERCERERKSRGWWIFNNADIWFSESRIKEPWEKSANLRRPEKLYLPKTSEYLYIDKSGIHCGDTSYSWDQVLITGFMIDRYEKVRRSLSNCIPS